MVRDGGRLDEKGYLNGYSQQPPQKVVINIDRYRNTTGARIPLAMQTAIEDGRLRKGRTVLLAAVGAGFTTGTTLRWAYQASSQVSGLR